MIDGNYIKSILDKVGITGLIYISTYNNRKQILVECTTCTDKSIKEAEQLIKAKYINANVVVLAR